MSKYFIGIDLGTTNSAVFHVPKDDADAIPQVFEIQQITALGESAKRSILPSFVYLPEKAEVPEGALDLPWKQGADLAVGEHARAIAHKLPGRVVSSSKSWLCAPGSERLGEILPWARKPDGRKMSPVAAAEAVLSHVRDAWNAEMAPGKKSSDRQLERQEVVLTVPASFDAVARELTVQAARRCGIEPALLEEPQAAFYAWLAEVGEAWRTVVRPDDIILVCDIGGGTTDFTLIQVADTEGSLGLERVAVGRHILLGGDNMDLSLARLLAAKLEASKKTVLDTQQLFGLVHACREAKEAMLSDPDAKPRKLSVLGRGSGLVGGTISVELTPDEVRKTILEGFFPECALSDAPATARKSGLRTFGLDYEVDAAVTRHLAQFLSVNAERCGMPTKVLFNGGVTKSKAVVERIISRLSAWGGGGSIETLQGTHPDLAVAQGAACYARVRSGKGIRIKAGSQKSYYVGVEPPMPAVPGYTAPLGALCVIPKGLEEGCGNSIRDAGLGLMVGERTFFRFFSSDARSDDRPGDFIEAAEGKPGFEELPPLSAELPAEDGLPSGTLVPVVLRCEFTETGTLQLLCESSINDSKWKLEFELRGTPAANSGG